MPIYEYRCQACGHQEEFLQRVNEPPFTECPVCHKPTFQKLLSAAGFQLKGAAGTPPTSRTRAPSRRRKRPTTSPSRRATPSPRKKRNPRRNPSPRPPP